MTANEIVDALDTLESQIWVWCQHEEVAYPSLAQDVKRIKDRTKQLAMLSNMIELVSKKEGKS